MVARLQAQDRAALRELTANLNDRHRNAQFAGRASAELHTLIFFQPKQVAADARIVKVTRHAVLPMLASPRQLHTVPQIMDRM